VSAVEWKISYVFAMLTTLLMRMTGGDWLANLAKRDHLCNRILTVLAAAMGNSAAVSVIVDVCAMLCSTGEGMLLK